LSNQGEGKIQPAKAPVMQEQIRQAIIDLILLSETMNSSERTRVLETIDRFRNIVGEDDYPISLYEKLFFETNDTLSA
jgi:hypothetical protein